MIVEMHCHTSEHSECSKVSAAELVQRNYDRGLDCTILTDHHFLWSPQELLELRSKLKLSDNYLILSGQEVSTPEIGDVLVYGAGVSIAKGTSLRAIREMFPHAAIIWAHPYRAEKRPGREEFFNPLIDGIEIFSSNHTIAESTRGVRDWHKYRFVAIGGTDTHALSYSGMYPTFFDHPAATIEELASEIRQGRCRPFFKEIPLSGTSDAHITEITVGFGDRMRERYVLKEHETEHAWRSSEDTIDILEELARHGFSGGQYRIPKLLGHDRNNLTIIEEAAKGESLFDMLVKANPQDAAVYLRLAAGWLAYLHNLRLRITPSDDFFRDESVRLERYIAAFHKMNHRHTRRAEEIMNAVIDTESALFCRHPERMVQGHGDFHPKNILIGSDDPGNPGSLFVTAVDFDSSYTMPPAFDVGTFIAQFRNQFFGNREVLSKVSEKLFLEEYLRNARDLDNNFIPQVELYIARTSLSISYYLIKVGMGTSENLWRVLIEAEHTLSRLAAGVKDWPVYQ
jgi:3',5'-nucleoside bisphosphate phosphatase